MGSEDFSYFLNEVPGCFFHIGTSGELPAPGQHSATYFMDENSLVIGASYWVTLVRNQLQAPDSKVREKTKIKRSLGVFKKEIVDNGFVVV
eukprot:TRINITY_DN11916_c0_g1_i1.p1 TRINITY_DN11916_c0_g1~~TRINITY_DN11916_c0_g1_i1.p1  ORF type:complete len:91 (+),score=11.37 TRINITY_DN11916_c0_g1_i1:180-452(+)